MSSVDSLSDVNLILSHSEEITLLMQNDVGNIMSMFNLPDDSQNYAVEQFSTQYPQSDYQNNYTHDDLLENDNKVDLYHPPGQNGNKIVAYQPVQNGKTLYEQPLAPPESVSPILSLSPNVMSSDDYAGPFNFEVYVDPHSGTKNPWVYSSKLNKLFITMSNPFPIDFKWDFNAQIFYVRATPLYKLAQHNQELVTRCIPHSLSTDPSNRNIPENMLNHVIRCQNPNAQYQGSKETNRHLNVLVPLGVPQTGSDVVRLMYCFVCKNSCPTGMNRKPFGVIFTLEDKLGNLLGRRQLNVRVCSCPKRDKDKEEKECEPGHAATSRKKRKLEKPDKKMLDTKEYHLALSISGKPTYIAVLNAVYDRIAGEIQRNGPNEALNKSLAQVQEHLNNAD